MARFYHSLFVTVPPLLQHLVDLLSEKERNLRPPPPKHAENDLGIQKMSYKEGDRGDRDDRQQQTRNKRQKKQEDRSESAIIVYFIRMLKPDFRMSGHPRSFTNPHPPASAATSSLMSFCDIAVSRYTGNYP
jgi:hypothetical protein